MRQVDPLGLEAWDDTKRPLKLLLLRAAGLDMLLADYTGQQLTAAQVIAIASAAARLEWQASALTAMAPLAAADARPTGRPSRPFPTISLQ